MRAKKVGKFELPVCHLSPQKVTKFLLTVVGLLILFNLGERVFVRWFNATHDGQIIAYYFNFDRELNFPSLYSALALGFSSYLLAIITAVETSRRNRYAKHWKALSLIFLGMAIDEAFSIHELSIPLLRSALNAGGIFYFTWVVPAFILLIIFAIAFKKFVISLPKKIKIIFITAAVTYVAGALGMELVGGYIADTFGYTTSTTGYTVYGISYYGISSSIEEILEMLAIVMFIHGLLTYIQSQLTELHFCLSFQPAKSAKPLARVSKGR